MKKKKPSTKAKSRPAKKSTTKSAGTSDKTRSKKAIEPKKPPKTSSAAKSRPDARALREMLPPYAVEERARSVTGPHHVWYPRSVREVAAAVVRSAGHKTFIRSGTQSTLQDRVDGTNAVVIDLQS